MNFLINQIKNQKILEMEVNVDEFIKSKGITVDAMIHTLVFAKSVFVKEEEVREYMKNVIHYWSEEINIVESDDSFTVAILNAGNFDVKTEVQVELRRGLVVHAADLVPFTVMEDFAFNDKGQINLSSKLSTKNFSGVAPEIIVIARVAKGVHPRYGEVELTQSDLESMDKNFEAKVTVIDLAVNEDHERKEAFGWYKDVWLSFDKQTLYGVIGWNTKGTTALAEKEYRYFSPEFRFNYKNPMTGIEHGPTLLGGALTNYPFLEMEAIVELSNKHKKFKEKKMSETIDLSTHNKEVVDLNGKINEVTVELNSKTAEVNTLTSKVKELEDTISLNAKKVAHDKLFDKGHINAAQLKALEEGKGNLEVLALSSKMSTNEKGTSEVDEDVIGLNSKEKKMAKSLDLTDEEFAAGNKQE